MQGREENELLDIWQKVKANYLVQICPQDSFQVHFFEKDILTQVITKISAYLFILNYHFGFPKTSLSQQYINSSSIPCQLLRSTK